MDRAPDSLHHEPEVEHVLCFVALQFVQVSLSLAALALGLLFVFLVREEHAQLIGLLIWASLVPLNLLIDRLKHSCEAEPRLPG